VGSSYAADLQLARRCAAGDPAAWDRFVLEYRPVLYRAADALDRAGRAREIADSLYAELYGIEEANGERQSLFRYFQGRSSLATWLRAVLAQRYVDRVRAERRLEPLPIAEVKVADASEPDPERSRYVALIRAALGRAVGRLRDRDRLRLAWYYVHDLTLAEIGRVLKEHEATVSRQIARTRRAIREDVEQALREEAGFTDAQVTECFASIAEDPGPLDLASVFDRGERRNAAPERFV
jgi:RNA polymerase sigma-70 factor (ECF subfamily)